MECNNGGLADALLFRTLGGNHYLYDTGTGSVHPWADTVPPSVVSAIYEAGDGTLDEVLQGSDVPSDMAEYIKRWRQGVGAFHTQPREVPRPHDGPTPKRPAIIADALPHRLALNPDLLSNLMLVVTDDCNLRCQYCIFSGQYDTFPLHRPQTMAWETAQKAVDYFLALNDSFPFTAMPDRKLDIAFFGGEPLLAWPLIRDTVLYAEASARTHYSLYFSFTSNLTVLPPEVLAFLIEHKIGVHVSLDGPQPIHDRYRTDRAGRGSFAQTYENLVRLREADSSYFEQYVRSIVTLTGNSDVVAINEFFESGDPNIPEVYFAGAIRDMEHGRFHKQFPYDATERREQHRRLVETYLERKKHGVPVMPGQFIYHYLEEALETLYKRVRRLGHQPVYPTTGTCTPGRRIAVSTGGQFHLCERINEHFPIGDVDHGLDPSLIEAVTANYEQALPDCQRCWARGLCYICYAQVAQDGYFCFRGRDCNATRSELAILFVYLYSLLEEVPGAFAMGDPLLDRYTLGELVTT